jgi:hypothetical protein
MKPHVECTDVDNLVVPIRLNIPIEEMIFNQKNNHLRKFGMDPDLLILGAQEYMDLCAAMSKTAMYGNRPGEVLWAANFHGMDIILADRPGISLGFKDVRKWSVVLVSEIMRPKRGVLRK